MSSSTATYTSIYSDYEPWRFQWVSDDEPQSPEAAPQSPEQAHPSPDYVPGLEHPPLPDYVPGPEYPVYVASSDDEVPIEDQPLPVDASPIALSPGYVADSDLEEDPEEDPADGGDEEKEEPSEDDADDEEEKASDNEEEEHPASADSTPPISPYIRVSFAQTRLCRARKTVRPHTPPSPSTEARLARFMDALALPSPPPSPLSPWSYPLPQIPSPPLLVPSLPLPLPPPTHTIPTYNQATLGYRAAMIRSRAASPSTHHPLEIPSPPLLLPSTAHIDTHEVDMPLQKRACFTAHTSRYEIGESSSAAAAARQTRRTLARSVDYGFIDTMDASIRASDSRVMTVVGEVNERVTDLAITQRQEAQELYVCCEDAQDDRALLRAQVSLLTREWRYFCSMASSYECEAAKARRAWVQSESRSQAMKAQIRALQRDVSVLQRQRIDDGDRLTSHI
ncbi:hypothetical protein Tco_0490707 [Tanacetum coccineum]